MQIDCPRTHMYVYFMEMFVFEQNKHTESIFEFTMSDGVMGERGGIKKI